MFGAEPGKRRGRLLRQHVAIQVHRVHIGDHNVRPDHLSAGQPHTASTAIFQFNLIHRFPGSDLDPRLSHQR